MTRTNASRRSRAHSDARSTTLDARFTVSVLAALLVPSDARATPQAATSEPVRTESIRLPVSRDTWVSTGPGEQDGNNGGEAKLKLKGYQEFSLVDLDPQALLGRRVTGAELHVRVASPDPQRRVTVSTIACEWTEGDGRGYDVQEGSASFRSAAHAVRPWSGRAGDITSVILGQGNTLWRWSDATPPDAAGWQTITVDPEVVAARVAGISGGFLLFDDVGSEYTRDGEAFEYRRFLNRFVFSRESGPESAPYFTLELGEKDVLAPDAVASLDVVPGSEHDGSVTLRWRTPGDQGPAGVIGFSVRSVPRTAEALLEDAPPDDLDWWTAEPVPQHLVPLAGTTGDAVTIRFRPRGAHEAVLVGVRAVDRAGNVSTITTRVVRATIAPVVLPSAPFGSFLSPGIGPAPSVAGLEVAIVDALDKVDPRTGTMLPGRPRSYRRANHLWSSDDRRIRLAGARNEVVDFQVVLSGGALEIDASVELETGLGRARLHRFAHVAAKTGALPDPLVPLTKPFALPEAERQPGIDRRVDGERHAMLLVEIEIARDARAAQHKGKLVIEADGERLEIPIGLQVWDFALPDKLAFLAEMNAYSLPDPPADLAYYRLAHEHRLVLNRLGYDWRGRVSRGCGPAWDGETFDWKEYDAHFGPLLDGSAFADLPRGPVPVEAFYLPLNENWPIPIESGFREGYWADQALDPAYLAAFSKAASAFAAHVDAQGWRDTLFEFYLNNKIYFKEREWSRSSAPWIFDEPENTQDFFALRVFGEAFHAGVAAAGGSARLLFRCDLSRPEWRRDLLDGVVDVAVVGHALRAYPRWVNEKRERCGEIVQNYSTANAIEESNVQPVAWCLDAWSLGADGVIPWQTIGNDASWRKADPLALFYPGAPAGSPVPLASVRLKAFRRGEQDVEYLVRLAAERGTQREEIAAALRQRLALDPRAAQRHSDDAGTLVYPGVLPEHLWSLRTAIGSELDRAGDARPTGLLERPRARCAPTPSPEFTARQRTSGSGGATKDR